MRIFFHFVKNQKKQKKSKFAVTQLSMALLEGDDVITGHVRYFYSSINTEILRKIVTARNVASIQNDLRNGIYGANIEELTLGVEGSKTRFLFFCDFALKGELLL